MRILMVCLGNICRSPLAHGIMQHLADEAGLDWEVGSAGTGDWHVGECPDRRSIAVARDYGVDISKQRAQHFNSSLFGQYDKIIAMDRQNLADILAQAHHEEDRDKVTLFLDNDEVPDPYWDNALFEPVYQMVEKRSRELLNIWAAETGGKE